MQTRLYDAHNHLQDDRLEAHADSVWRELQLVPLAFAVVNGSWKLVGWVAGVARGLQSGYLYHYALAMIVGILVLMSYFVTWPMLVEWLGR